MSTTILESYDAQMDYLGDFDVAMQVAGSTDGWLYQGESIMDQDGQHDSQSLGAADRESVEVDMEEYPDADHESVEYEMGDEEGIYEPEGGDLLDVEVYDAHSPAPTTVIDFSQTTSNDNTSATFQTPSVLLQDGIAAPDPPVIHDAPHVQPNDELLAPEATMGSSPRPEEFQEATVALSDGQAELSLGESATNISHTAIGDGVLHSSHDSEVVGTIERSDNGVGHDVGEEHTAVDREAEALSSLPHPQDHEAASLDQQAEVADTANNESEDYHETSQQYNDPAATDPHEISEGIYIDPPPAVLLSLPSSDQPEICLFNQPASRTGSNSPVEDTHSSGQQALTLLLHHRPTLYYEPLTSVFEALRQEEYVSRVPDFAEGELALDAYDLQLVISEVRFIVVVSSFLVDLYWPFVFRIMRTHVILHYMT